jgi:hypothetical protein
LAPENLNIAAFPSGTSTMYKYLSDNLRTNISILSLSITITFALFLLESHQGFSLLDEGYLWYGAQRVMVGEVPMRDFMSYDIGRYYWSAAFMSLLGDNGIVALRVAIAVFQAIALFITLSLLTGLPAKQNRYFLLLAAITLVAWMAPQYRLFDISLPIILVGTLSFLIDKPSSRRYFLTGLIVGLVAVFGRNHGIYGVAGSVGAMAYLNIRGKNGPSTMTAFTFWLLGVVAGYLPVLVFLAVVPGFAPAFGESIRSLFEVRATNIPLPVPWPWLVPFENLPIVGMLSGVLEGIFFIGIVVFGITGVIWAIRKRLQGETASPVLIAAIFLTPPYAHFAYSRADLSHLAPGIPPFLIGILALLANQPAKIKWPFAVLLLGASLLVMLPAHPRWYCYVYSNKSCIDIKVGRDKLHIDRQTYGDLIELNKLAERYAPGDRPFIAAPYWPGAYAALGRKSPMWEIYVSPFPPTVALQQAEIERIKAANPGFVLIDDFPLDGRDDLRFHNTHPIIDQYIRNHFEVLNGLSGNPEFQVYRNKQAGK